MEYLRKTVGDKATHTMVLVYHNCQSAMACESGGSKKQDQTRGDIGTRVECQGPFECGVINSDCALCFFF